MWGWFSAFREHGAPTFYGEHRTPVTIDTQIASIVAAFLIPSFAFLCILPGVRKKKFISTLSFFVCVIIGATLLVSLFHPCWHRGEMRISSSFRSFSSENLDAHLLVRVGLSYMNISLTAERNGSFDGMKYNERFSFTEIRQMDQELEKALHKGLPYPILKVIEYLSAEGFSWGRQYRVAGHYTATLLWLSMANWLVTVGCLFFLPSYFPLFLFSTGFFIALADLVFITQLPRRMLIYFHTQKGSVPLFFRPSICFQATCFVALLCLLVGGILLSLEKWNKYHFDTLFTSIRNAEESVVDRKIRAKNSTMPPSSVEISRISKNRSSNSDVFVIRRQLYSHMYE